MTSDLHSTAGADTAPAPTAMLPIGADLPIAAFAPGRYATAIQRTLSGTHELQLVRETSVASLALELDADGSARVCRGWRYQMTNDGPEVHTEDRFREQAGFRGKYAERDGGIDVDLRRDDTVCPPIAEHTYAPARAATIRLRCVAATPTGHPILTRPVLICTWLGPTSPEQAAHAVTGLGPDGAWVLGAAPGLIVEVTGGLPELESLEPATLEARVAAVADDAWQQP